MCAKSLQLCLTLCNPMDCNLSMGQSPLSIGFSRQEYWSGLPTPSFRGSFPPKHRTRVSCIGGGFLPLVPPGKPQSYHMIQPSHSCGTYRHWDINYSAVKKNEVMPLAATWMDLDRVMLSEVRQRVRDIIRHPLYVECKKK